MKNFKINGKAVTKDEYWKLAIEMHHKGLGDNCEYKRENGKLIKVDTYKYWDIQDKGKEKTIIAEMEI